ncbi:DUF1003 domain-containing protein [Actinoplanes sp. LDG1-06]|uniref:DUF1003 domain-containing protein n=1 Tax=Paractinoplanes ovalisporus TaxID=2810368 RepID=A0ABS2A8X7_9ACTN|nr:DUF1003 domain-containing protein [Actinoplanes ovalisporus]MBM2616293.1 DUF1003 domain-containing protein [Actinoplanes ovalisporus]
MNASVPGGPVRDRYGHSLHPANQFRHDRRSFGQRLADSVTAAFGSWNFIVVQTAIVSSWILLNAVAFFRHWDPYPFILLNLLFSTQAAYAAPLILLSQNRQADTDRVKAEHDYQVNQLALQYLIAWHRDTHGDSCACVRDSGPAVQAALTAIAHDVRSREHPS